MTFLSATGSHDPLQLAAAALIGALLIYIVSKVLASRRLPPGPIGLPIMGYLPFLSDDWHLDFKILGKKYGPIFSLYIGQTPVIVLNDSAVVNEYAVKNPTAFAGRPYSYGFAMMGCNTENLFKDTYTPKWKNRKKFAMAALRGHGLMSQTMFHEKMEDQITVFVETIRKHLGSPINLRLFLGHASLNIVTKLFFDRTYDIEDDEIKDVIDATNDWFTAMVIVCQSDVVPFFRFLQTKAVVNKGKTGAARLREYFIGVINDHRQEFDKNNPRDFVDLCIQKSFDDEEILLQLFSLWGDATDTTGATIRWWLFFISRHPEIQKKLQAEVDEFIGRERLPKIVDKYNLNYLEATLMEAFRIASAVPISLPLETIEPTTVMGYAFPKNTHYIINYYNMHTDPSVWGDPESFRPERFYDEKGDFQSKHEALMPFGVGKRSCIGEPVFREIAFLFCVRLLQNFSFNLTDQSMNDRSDMAERERLAITGVTNTPADFTMIVHSRDDD